MIPSKAEQLEIEDIKLEPKSKLNTETLNIYKEKLIDILLRYDDNTAKLLDFNTTHKFNTRKEAENFLSINDNCAIKTESFYITQTQDNTTHVIGNISAALYQYNSFENDINTPKYLVSFGCFIDPSYFNKGIASKALKKLTQLYLNSDLIKGCYWMCKNENLPSKKLATKVFSQLVDENKTLTFSSTTRNLEENGFEIYEALLTKPT